jgi:hypothetical protein
VSVRRLAILVMCGVLLAACGTTSTSAARHPTPTLGFPRSFRWLGCPPDAKRPCSRPRGSGGKGWGTTRPRTIYNGGDETGLLTSITWSTWGGTKALGRGVGLYVSPTEDVAHGSFATAFVVAFKLGTCDAHWVYMAVEWYFPGKGQRFTPQMYESWCNGLGYIPGDPPPYTQR